MTLIEVIVGMALLGTVLVGLLTTRAALSRQRVDADKRLEAVRVCDALLARWQVEGKPVPRNASGFVGEREAFRWNTSVTRIQRVQSLSFDVVRLQVADGHRGKPLASVEVLVPDRSGL